MCVFYPILKRGLAALFVLALLPARAQTVSVGAVSPPAYCQGASIQVPVVASGTFGGTNVFTAQLSDASGDFSAPLTIGTLSATTSGTIHASLPANLPGGNGYRMRIVSSAPALTSTPNAAAITIVAPTVGQPGNVTACAGTPTAAIPFAGTAGRYRWTNSNPAIGLPASGEGTIPSFTPVNNTGLSQTATITVTPMSTTGIGGSGYAYVPNFNGNTVHVVDLASQTLVANVTVGLAPRAVAVLPDNSRVYVANYASNTVSVISTASNTVIATIPVGNRPHGVAATPDGNRVFVTNDLSSTVSEISTATNTVTRTEFLAMSPRGCAMAPDGSVLYYTSNQRSRILLMNTTTLQSSETSFAAQEPNGVAVLPNGSKVYTASFSGNYAAVYIPPNIFSVLSGIIVGQRPWDLAAAPDNGKVYVANWQGNSVAVLNAAADTVMATIPVSAPTGLSLSRDGSRLYVLSSANGALFVINTANNQVLGQISIPGGAWSLGNFITGPLPVQCTGPSMTFTITVKPPQAAGISYAGSPFCTTAPNGNVSLNGASGGTFSATPAGLSIDAATGTINPSLSGPGNYTVSYALPAADGCAAVTVSTPVTITLARFATIAYTGTPYCRTGGQAFATVNGNALGTFSSNNGLSLNASNGTVNLGTSVPGFYGVTYTIPAGGGCPAVTATTGITITAPAQATIVYPSPICSNAGITPVSRNGTAGGTFTAAPAGLTIDVQTGAIDPINSTPGAYTVTYTIPPTGGCPAFSATSNVSIAGAPSAAISYPGSPYCSNGGTATISLTGTTGGVFSAAPAGLSINSNTGAVNLGASSPGTYTVTYALAAANGCAALNVTTTIVVVPTPPTPVITQNGGSLQSSAPAGNQWFLNGQPQAGLTGQTIAPLQSGNYTVQVMLNGCASAVSSAVPFIPSSVPSISQGVFLRVAPNPVRNHLQVRSQGYNGGLRLRITGISGKVLVEDVRFSVNYDYFMGHYPPGLYVAEVYDERGRLLVREKVLKR